MAVLNSAVLVLVTISILQSQSCDASYLGTCVPARECYKLCPGGSQYSNGGLQPRTINQAPPFAQCWMGCVCCEITYRQFYSNCGTSMKTVKRPADITPPRPHPANVPSQRSHGRPANVLTARTLSTNPADSVSELGDYPWMGALLYNEDECNPQYIFHGGVSLISPRVALTAAHKVSKINPKNLLVRFNDVNLQKEDVCNEHVDVKVKEVVVHPGFHSEKFDNNIALLFLEFDIPLTGFISPICLPPNIQFCASLDLEHCYVAGWGAQHFQDPKIQPNLASVRLPIVDKPSCVNNLSRHVRNFHLFPSQICAGGIEGNDACYGDGGSPLICPLHGEPTKFFQVGIVSHGYKCGLRGVPGIYTNVAVFVDWINAVIQQH